MYRILIAADDILMCEAMRKMISREQRFEVVSVVGTGEQAVKRCKETLIDIVFMDVQMPGITGIAASRMIYQANPEISIYLISAHFSGALVRSKVSEPARDVLEKPITYAKLKNILENHTAEQEYFVQDQLNLLLTILNCRDFGQFYHGMKAVVQDIYTITGYDPQRLLKVFHYLGQILLNTRKYYDENETVSELFPINSGLILEPKTSELWLFRLIDYLFRKNSISRYPVLENIFLYLEKHVKEDITLNTVVENCAISQGYLSRIFREQFKVSVTEYIHMRKLHLAKGYFYFTDSSIGEIAFRLGYNESSYFSKVFKKYENMTVKEYKNVIRKSDGGNGPRYENY